MGVHADYDSMTAVAGVIRTKQEELAALFREVTDVVNDLTSGDFVSDEASVEYDLKMQDFVDANTANVENFETFAAWLEQAAATLQDTDGQLSGSIG